MGNWTERSALTGKSALVTGATKGIGIETCKVLADAGADIVAVGRDAAGLAEVEAAVKAAGRRCMTIAADRAPPMDQKAEQVRWPPSAPSTSSTMPAWRC